MEHLRFHHTLRDVCSLDRNSILVSKPFDNTHESCTDLQGSQAARAPRNFSRCEKTGDDIINASQLSTCPWLLRSDPLDAPLHLRHHWCPQFRTSRSFKCSWDRSRDGLSRELSELSQCLHDSVSVLDRRSLELHHVRNYLAAKHSVLVQR